MVKTWASGQGGDVTCAKCGSVYAVTIRRFPHRDKDSYNCDVCGYLLDEWNSTSVPFYELKTRGTAPSGGA